FAMWLVIAAVPVVLVQTAQGSGRIRVRRRGAKGGLDGVADSVPGVTAGQHGNALAQTAAQRGQVITQPTEAARRVAHRMGEQRGRAHGSISLGWAEQRRASQGVRGGN